MAKDLFGLICNLFAAHQLNKFCNSALQLISSVFAKISLIQNMHHPQIVVGYS